MTRGAEVAVGAVEDDVSDINGKIAALAAQEAQLQAEKLSLLEQRAQILGSPKASSRRVGTYIFLSICAAFVWLGLFERGYVAWEASCRRSLSNYNNPRSRRSFSLV